MTLIAHLHALPRRLPPFPMWGLMVLSSLSIGAACVMLVLTVEVHRRLAAAERAEAITLQRQHSETLRALGEDVRRLRETVEGRSTTAP